MTDRELMQWALDALEGYARNCRCEGGGAPCDAAEALRARLANEFNPDWDAMAVMVEEQQRMAKRIEELEAALAQPEEPDWAAAGFSKPPKQIRQCPSCGGFCKKSGCERENVQPPKHKEKNYDKS